jgi:hypothetical protein
MTKTAHAQASRLRRSLLQVSSLLLLSILATGLLGQFSAWSLNNADANNNHLLGEYIDMVDAARGAQATFKTQVQEWKNILIRGADQAEREKYLAAFVKSEVETDAKLSALSLAATRLSLKDRIPEIESAQSDHRTLGSKYREALAKDGTTTFNPAALDATVRGIDRGLDARLSSITVSIIGDEITLVETYARLGNERYLTLSRTLWILMGVSLILIANIVIRMLREHS